jgi:hypothetical protein
MYKFANFSIYAKENESEPEVHHFAFLELDPEHHKNDTVPQHWSLV